MKLIKNHMMQEMVHMVNPKKSIDFGKFFASLFTEDNETAILQTEDYDLNR